MDHYSLSFLRTIRTHLQELETTTAAHPEIPLGTTRAEAALAAARRAFGTIERFVQGRPVQSEHGQNA
jgi:hypothetical protein